jgi:peptide/nickel transport system substrate-binding protein
MSSYKLWPHHRQPTLALLVFITVTVLILACGGVETPGPTATATGLAATPTATTSTVATPTPTATSTAGVPVSTRLRVASEPPSAWHTVTWPASNLDMSWQPMCEHLIDTDRKSAALIPQLATEWSVAPNGKDWTYKLRKDVPFY